MTAPPYPAKGTTDWYEPLHDYTEGIRDEADDKLALKADTASLGTAAFANTGAFATAAQGTKADSAVQPAGIAGLITDQHTHANKLVLDGITDAKLVPQNGKWYQELRRGVTNPEWIDPPGMTIPLVTMTPDMSLSRDGVLTPTVTTPRVVDVDGGHAWFMEEGTTNRVKNPRNITASASANFLKTTYVDAEGFTVTRIERIAAGNYAQISNMFSGESIAAGTPITFSCEIRGYRASSHFGASSLQLRNAANDLIYNTRLSYSELYPHATNWQRMWATAAAQAEIVVSGVWNVDSWAGAVGDWFEVRKFQSEDKSYATSYADGSLGTGYSWSGTPNASASNRANATVTLSLPWLAGTGLENLGSIYVRRYIDSPRGTYNGVVQLRGGASTPPIMQMRQDLGNLKQIIGISEPTYVEHNRPESVGLADVYLGWNATQIFGETTNTGMVTQARSGSSPMWGANIPSLYIGSNSSVSPYVVAVLLFDRLLTRAEKDLLKKTPTSKLAGMGAFYALAPQAGADPGFVPTNKIAAGGTTMRNAPGTGSDTIATLNADTRVTDTTGRQNVSGVDYARVTTSVLGSGWIPLTALAAL
jgi:hypothetical protein